MLFSLFLTSAFSHAFVVPKILPPDTAIAGFGDMQVFEFELVFQGFNGSIPLQRNTKSAFRPVLQHMVAADQLLVVIHFEKSNLGGFGTHRAAI
jgi:hypothetical protein